MEDLKRKGEAKQARHQAESIAAANRRGTATPRLTNPKLISKVEPSYTSEARLNRVEGSIVMVCEIAEDGYPHMLAVLSRLGYGLDQQALAAVSRWHFEPALKDGQPVTSLVIIEVNFKLM